MKSRIFSFRRQRQRQVALAIALISAAAIINAIIGSHVCPRDNPSLACRTWSVGYPAIFGVAFAVAGWTYAKRLRRNVASAGISDNGDSLWLLFDRRDVRADVSIAVTRGGTCSISARHSEWDNDGPTSMTILYFGRGNGFIDDAREIPVPDLHRLVPHTSSPDPDVAIDYGETLAPRPRRRIRELNGRSPDQGADSAARISVLGRGFVDDEDVARCQMMPPRSAESTASEEAGTLPRIEVRSDMLTRMKDGPEFRRMPIQRFQLQPGGELWDGATVRLRVSLVDDRSSSKLPRGFRLTWSNPEPVNQAETTWTTSETVQPSYVMLNQGIRDSANNEALIAGVLLGAGAGFVAPLLDKLMVFLS